MTVQVPLIPESAPFTPGQRAWLNGFFAGLLNVDPASLDEGAAATQLSGGAAVAERPALLHDEQDLPWHDSALPIDERMQMVQDKPLPLKLMGAMAQLDCGACGYQCQTYAKAIADGEEKDLTRCVPGGRETAKTLKKVLAESGGAAAAGSSGGADAPAAAGFDRNNPCPAPLVAVKRLNREGSEKDVRFVALDLAGSGITYEAGDSLGVYPVNCPELVAEITAALGVHERSAAGEVLLKQRTITQIDEDQVNLLAAWAADPAEAAALKQLAADDDAMQQMDLLDLLRRFPSARPPADDLLESLHPLQPRLYSISSSPKAHPEEVHLTVGVVRYDRGGRVRKGVASTFFAERFESGQMVGIFAQKSHGFRLPADPAAPVIMVGPGTGIAPFRAFLEERKVIGATGDNWLFFGDQRRETDYLYEHELTKFVEDGLLTRLDLAFSRDQAEKIYVQHRMLEHAVEVWRWLQRGAHLYVCGDAKRMARDVDQALRRIIAEQSGMSREQADAYVAEMTRGGRYARDVY